MVAILPGPGVKNATPQRREIRRPFAAPAGVIGRFYGAIKKPFFDEKPVFVAHQKRDFAEKAGGLKVNPDVFQIKETWFSFQNETAISLKKRVVSR